MCLKSPLTGLFLLPIVSKYPLKMKGFQERFNTFTVFIPKGLDFREMVRSSFRAHSLNGLLFFRFTSGKQF
jgi:hypothetical protein